MKTRNAGERADIYTRITEKIVADLEKGVRPWMKPWSMRNATGRITRPLRHNGEFYSGMNVILLWSEAVARGFASSTWMTFKQAVELGGCVRKGETGTTVVFASRFTKTEEVGGAEVEKAIPFLKTYTVFCVDQIDGLPERFHGEETPAPKPMERIEAADRFFASTGADIRHGGNQAFYSPLTDHIQMPHPESFRDMASYVATLSHEATHWTSSSHRVGRDLSRYAKDRSDRAREELIAELGSCFLCADLGIVPELKPRPDHASYIDSWLRVLSNDRRAIFSAAAHAQRAVAYLHGLQTVASEDRRAA
jgi:antirestriction protein ArdC